MSKATKQALPKIDQGEDFVPGNVPDAMLDCRTKSFRRVSLYKTGVMW